MAIDVLSSVTLRGMQSPETLYQKATSFIKQLYQELDLSGMEERLNEIKIEIEQSGTYTHSFQELEHGVRIAWRNSNCTNPTLMTRNNSIKFIRWMPDWFYELSY